MTQRPWMPFYFGDYFRDTNHLSNAEHGAYLRLLAYGWSNGALPSDDDAIRRLACMTREEWVESGKVLRAFFREDGTHKRIEKETQKTIEMSEKRRGAANKRWMHKDSKSNANASGNDANALQMECHSHSHSHSHIKDSKKEAAADAAPDARTVLFTEGLKSLHRQTGRPESALRPLVGRWLRDVEDDAVLVHRAIEDAERNRVADPVAWITRALRPKIRPLTAQIAKDLNRAKWSDALERLGEFSQAAASGDVREEVIQFLPPAGGRRS